MRALAACPNVSVKLSELGLPDREWSENDNVPILRETIDIFGQRRCLFASNFPVARMRVGFGRWVAAVSVALDVYAPGDRADVFGANARRVYGVQETNDNRRQ